MRRLPATVITGFLGAGKTSLVRHLIEQAAGRRLALIVNEFGDVGVDGGLLAACGAPSCRPGDIIELANGCLCCTVADEFLPTMQALLDRPEPPDHILIETSGLALPKPLVTAFRWPEIRSRVTVDGVIAVVDGAAFATGRFTSTPEQMARPDHDNPLEEVFTDQLATADIVLLNKVDLLDAAALAQVRGRLAAAVRPGVHLLETTHGAVDARVVLGLDAAVEDDLAARPTHHDAGEPHQHDDFESFAVTLPELTDPEALEARLRAAIAEHDILRLKGFVAIAGRPARAVIQAAGPRLERYFDRMWGTDEPRAGQLVVIGCRGLDRAAITRRIQGAAA
jgi:cobalamin biosynthesis protein CobW